MNLTLETFKEIHFLVVADSTDHAEILSNGLRNLGIVARYQQLKYQDELDQALENSGSFDLVLVERDTPLSIDKVLNRISEAGLPSIVLATEGEYSLRGEMISMGASEAVIWGDAQHIISVILRIAHHSRLIRRVQILEGEVLRHEFRAIKLLNSSRDAIAMATDGMLTFANTPFLELFGIASDEIEITSLLDLVSDAHKQAVTDFIKHGDAEQGLEFVDTIQCNEIDAFECSYKFTAVSKDGERQIELHAEEVINTTLVDHSIDIRTGVLTNTAFFERYTAQTASIDQGHCCGILLIELRDFELAKKAVGLEHADALLHEVGTLVQGRGYIDNGVSFISDHEVLVFTTLGKTIELRRFADELISAFETHRFAATANGHITIRGRIGVHIIVSSSEPFSHALSEAKLALQEADEKGENVVVHNPLAQRERDDLLVNQVMSAVKQNAFALFYQPLVSVNGAPDHIYEVLIRMKTDGDNLLMPNQFIPLAENYEVMDSVDRWVFKQALMVLMKDADRDLKLIVKLSSNTLFDKRLGESIGKVMVKAGLDRSKMIFEISESSLDAHLPQIRAFTEFARHYGFKTVLSGFGRHSSSVSLLSQIEVDYLKLAPSLTRDIGNDQSMADQLIAVVTELKKKGVVIILPYMEDPRSLALGYQIGIDYIQGNFLAEPEPTRNFSWN